MSILKLKTGSIAYDEDMLDLIINFIEKIGIKVIEQELDDTSILPGLRIKANIILLDKKRLKHPGDLLHEAGHLAVTNKEDRLLIGTAKMSINWPSEGDEIAAILWSYAAICHLGIKADIVFHAKGYKNESEWLIDQFENENYIGLPLLEWMGLCYSADNRMENKPIFPKMIKWMR